MRRQRLLLSVGGRSVDNQHECVCHTDAYPDTDPTADQYSDQNAHPDKDPDTDADNDTASDQHAAADEYPPSRKHITTDKYAPSDRDDSAHQNADRCRSMRQELRDRCGLSVGICLYDRICHHQSVS